MSSVPGTRRRSGQGLHFSIAVLLAVGLFLLQCPAQLLGADAVVADGDFEAADLAAWKAAGPAEVMDGHAHGGAKCLHLGPGAASVRQEVSVHAGTSYRVSAWLRCRSAAHGIFLEVAGLGGEPTAMAAAALAWTRVQLPFRTGPATERVTIGIRTGAEGWADDVRIEDLGPVDAAGAAAEAAPSADPSNSIVLPAPRVVRSEFGVAQLDDEHVRWLREAKFGMLIHWGLYAGPGRGEWMMNNEAVTPEAYRRLADPASGDEYFAADRYDPAAWAALAKAAGMRWMCLTARHHDGYNLFAVPHPNAFTSMQTHHRDFIADYVAAVRSAGLRVGIFFSPLDWRYPGYFDVSGTDCKPNGWGYVTDPLHKENARLMKEENYAAVKQLLTAYGHIDYFFWDGGWLGLQGSDADAAVFHEPGRYLDPANPWPVGRTYQDLDPASGKALGIMGMTRLHQPDAITNSRYGWIGDIQQAEGNAPVVGPVRSDVVIEKCVSIHDGEWGYSAAAVRGGNVMTRDEIVRMLADCVVRDMTLQVSVGPDRHGVIPELEAGRLQQVGVWVHQHEEAIYGTRGGPWQPLDDRYGYCWRNDTIFVHLLKGYDGDSFTMPPVGPLTAVAAWQVMGRRPLTFTQRPDRQVVITGIDRSPSPVDTVIAVRFDDQVLAHAQKR